MLLNFNTEEQTWEDNV